MTTHKIAPTPHVYQSGDLATLGDGRRVMDLEVRDDPNYPVFSRSFGYSWTRTGSFYHTGEPHMLNLIYVPPETEESIDPRIEAGARAMSLRTWRTEDHWRICVDLVRVVLDAANNHTGGGTE